MGKKATGRDETATMSTAKTGMRWHEVLHPDKKKDKIFTILLLIFLISAAVASLFYLFCTRSQWVGACITLGFIFALLDVLIVCAARDDNKGMQDLLRGMQIVCGGICALFLVALGVYWTENYKPGIGVACICLVFFLVQFGCFTMAARKLKKMPPSDSQAYRRFRKCKFYAMLLVAVIVLVTVAVLFAPEETARQTLGVFAGSFVSLMVFTQMVDVYMIEVPKEDGDPS